ncbi:putative disease resistance RPP13-like protein 1 [Triticum aestivum]|uniref:putative disease resistance RPP13-like protein 1 n=1 Tax=Triticum aestivum TaxID=4565 RepID=UPI001D00F99E|nr:putative disease resistance RPP13-like protein 1 [Triticum aestivum]
MAEHIWHQFFSILAWIIADADLARRTLDHAADELEGAIDHHASNVYSASDAPVRRFLRRYVFDTARDRVAALSSEEPRPVAADAAALPLRPNRGLLMNVKAGIDLLLASEPSAGVMRAFFLRDTRQRSRHDCYPVWFAGVQSAVANAVRRLSRARLELGGVCSDVEEFLAVPVPAQSQGAGEACAATARHARSGVANLDALVQILRVLEEELEDEPPTARVVHFFGYVPPPPPPPPPANGAVDVQVQQEEQQPEAPRSRPLETHNFKILVYAWISQSFVQCEDPTMRLEEAGQKYLDRLVDLGFFQKDGSCYVMHDLMHELAGTVSSNECATVHGLKHVAIRPSVRHLSIITTVFDKDEYGSLPKEKFDKILQKVGPLQKLRTFMLFGQSSIHLLGSLHTLCKKAKCLRFLRIWVAFTDMSFINSLLNLCHLRYLVCVSVVTPSVWSDGFYTNIAFPQALTRFYHLQVLNVGVQGNLVVPTDMYNLVNLCHLISHEKAHHAIACVGNMTSLQELRFKVQNADSFEISQLQSMDELVQLEISQLENVKTKEEAMGARLFDKEYLEILSLSWEDNSTSLQPEAAKDVLEGLQPHHDLKSLEITGYGGATSPTWLSSTLSVTSLQILHLENCREWKILRSIEMPSLRKLTLIRMLNLMGISVPSLEELTLIDMPKLEKCIGSYGMELTSSLSVLMMKNCPQLNEFTLFQSYSSFDAQQKSWFTSLGKLSIGQCPRIMNNWPILPLREMRALKELELMDLHDVRELTVPSLEKLVILIFHNLRGITSFVIGHCPNLASLSSEAFSQLIALECLYIFNCPNLNKSNIMSEVLPPSQRFA